MPSEWVDVMLIGLMYLPSIGGLLYAVKRARDGERALNRAIEATGADND